MYYQNALAEWEEIAPGGNTLCGRGEPFSFFVYQGSGEKVVIDFIGGGACWDENTCSKEGATFIDSVDMVREQNRAGLKGIYDHENENNPIDDWTHVVIPYCTGDIHWGESDHVYHKENGESFTIYHRGAINVKAVMSWVEENLTEPEKLLMTGCSAGSYGSAYWTPHFKRLFPNSRISQLGDSGAGVVTTEFMEQSLVNWRSDINAPKWIPGINPEENDWRTMGLNDYYIYLGLFHPEIQLGQFNYLEDEGQVFFHEIMGGDSDQWSLLLQKSLGLIGSHITNFDSYLAEGDDHCILPYSKFYTENSGGKLFRDWFADRIQ